MNKFLYIFLLLSLSTCAYSQTSFDLYSQSYHMSEDEQHLNQSHPQLVVTTGKYKVGVFQNSFKRNTFALGYAVSEGKYLTTYLGAAYTKGGYCGSVGGKCFTNSSGHALIMAESKPYYLTKESYVKITLYPLVLALTFGVSF